MRDTRRRRAPKRGILEHQYAPVRFLRSDQRPGLEQHRPDIVVMPDRRDLARLRLVPLYSPQNLPERGKILGSDTAVIGFTLGAALRLFSHVGVTSLVNQLLRYLEAVELRGVLAHQLAFVGFRHFAEFAGQDFLRMGPCRGAMWIVSRPHEVISADVTIYLQAERVVDECGVDLPAEIVRRLERKLYVVRFLICVVVMVRAGQQLRYPSDIIFRGNQSQLRKFFENAIEDENHQRGLHFLRPRNHMYVAVARITFGIGHAFPARARQDMQRERHFEILRRRPERIVSRRPVRLTLRRCYPYHRALETELLASVELASPAIDVV